MPIQQATREAFGRLHSELDALLNAPIGTTLEAGPPTRREIFETFLYGTRAHANPDKAAKIERWKATSLWGMLESEFTQALADYVRVVGQLVEVNERALHDLASHS